MIIHFLPYYTCTNSEIIKFQIRPHRDSNLSTRQLRQVGHQNDMGSRHIKMIIVWEVDTYQYALDIACNNRTNLILNMLNN